MSSCLPTPERIDAILPQTQCGLCGYGGCMPYAIALVEENAAINLCPPGGVKVLKKIAELVNKDPVPYLDEMAEKTKPTLRAVIREDECIGCTKCIQACPVDAILGSAKAMHTVIAAECTGCQLCVAPCPVDCIDLFAIAELAEDEEKQKADLARTRFNARNERLAREQMEPTLRAQPIHTTQQTLENKKAFIEEALARSKLKNITPTQNS